MKTADARFTLIVSRDVGRVWRQRVQRTGAAGLAIFNLIRPVRDANSSSAQENMAGLTVHDKGEFGHTRRKIKKIGSDNRG